MIAGIAPRNRAAIHKYHAWKERSFERFLRGEISLRQVPRKFRNELWRRSLTVAALTERRIRWVPAGLV